MPYLNAYDLHEIKVTNCFPCNMVRIVLEEQMMTATRSMGSPHFAMRREQEDFGRIRYTELKVTQQINPWTAFSDFNLGERFLITRSTNY